MLRRWYSLLLILLTVVAFCLMAAAKLRATPKYDRVRVGMTIQDAMQDHDVRGAALVGPGTVEITFHWSCDEGDIDLACDGMSDRTVVTMKTIKRRGQLERLAWLAGWRPDPVVPRRAVVQ